VSPVTLGSGQAVSRLSPVDGGADRRPLPVPVSSYLVFGMAAVAHGDGTRFGFLAGLRLPGKRWWSPLLAPARRRIGRRALRRFENRFGVASTVDGVSRDTGVSGE
jgi:hypothetical protein